jgi:hypothetical protein
MPRKPVTYTFESFADGVNRTDPVTEVGDRYFSRSPRYQARDALDLMLHSKKQRPGSLALNYEFNSKGYGLGTYLRHDGTDYLLSAIGNKLYQVNKDETGYTELFDFGGSGEAWFRDILDICIVANGVKTVKVEGGSAYQLGISAPTGASAAAAAGGSLAAGTYNVYVSYARKVDGSNVLYSQGQSLGSVVLSGGNLTVRVTFPNSSDAQVNNKVVWMTDAGGLVYYYYGESGDNSTTTIDITSDANKSTAILYSSHAETNYAVPAFEYIAIMNNYVYGSVSNVLYRSRQAGTRYQLERFDTSTTGDRVILPFAIKGIFVLGEHMYCNTPGGIIKIPYGDTGSSQDHVEKREYFRYPRTVREYSGHLIGVTNRGRVAAFDGDKILPYDIAQDIKPWTDKLVTGSNTGHEPAAEIYRASDRNEYHLGFRNLDYGTVCNNRRLVLNLDKLAFLDNNQVIAPWEMWSNGFEYMVVCDDGSWYCQQSADTKTIIYKKHSTRKRDYNIYVGSTLETAKEYGFTLTTGTVLTSIKGIVRWIQTRLLATYSQDVTVLIYVPKYQPKQDSNVFDVSGTSQPM